jgi:hypothetical protein
MRTKGQSNITPLRLFFNPFMKYARNMLDVYYYRRRDYKYSSFPTRSKYLYVVVLVLTLFLFWASERIVVILPENSLFGIDKNMKMLLSMTAQ